MQIVIDIPEHYYENNIKKELPICLTEEQIVGILPEHHGRLIDVSDIEWARHQEERNYIDYDVIDWDDIVNAPTIIEADKEGSESE